MNERIYYSRAAEERANRERLISMIIFLLLGMVGGAALALLFAPKSGDRARHELADTLNELSEKGSEATQHAMKQLERDMRDLRKKVDSRIDDLR
jgi:gas vesicle protein